MRAFFLLADGGARRRVSGYCSCISCNRASLYDIKPVNFWISKYRCPEPHCGGLSSKTRADLIRHTKSVHCKAADKHSCNYFGCNRKGDNGFVRNDKLMDHVRRVHKGKPGPGKAGRAIRPAEKK